jgi:putative tricarboxylic transport membrane protein
MEVFSNLLLGVGTAFSPVNLLYCFIGTLLGTLVGVLPGVGPMATIAMLLPITFSLSPASSLIMLAGIYYGAQYGGSTTAILVNMPGEAASAVTAIDGYQMAQNGRAGPALAIAAIGSFFAGSAATLVVAAFSLPLTAIALQFGQGEYFSLILLGLISSVVLAHGSVLKAVAMTIIGLLLGLVGTDVYTGAFRFTLGQAELADGLNIVAVAVGIFGIAEILRNLEAKDGRSIGVSAVGRLMPSLEDMRSSCGPILRGTAIGSLLGILPGGGALLSSFASYAVEKKLSATPQRFGHGAIEGVAGPESANNAGAQTSFIPMLTLGIPSNAIMALMIGALIIQGIVPGPSVIVNNPDLFWGLIVSMWIGNLMLVILNLPLVGIWVRLLTVPYNMLFPAILLFSMIGVYSMDGKSFDVYAVALFGLIGYFLTKLGFESVPLILGFVLGPMLEDRFRRAMILSDGDFFTFVERPISAVLLGLALVMLIMVALPNMRKKRSEIFSEEAESS